MLLFVIALACAPVVGLIGYIAVAVGRHVSAEVSWHVHRRALQLADALVMNLNHPLFVPRRWEGRDDALHNRALYLALELQSELAGQEATNVEG